MAVKAGATIDLNALKVAGEPNKYVTMVTGEGIRVHEAGAVNTNFAQINSDGMDVVKGGTSVAAFGETSRIGNKSATHVEISSQSLDLMVSDTVGIRIITDNSNNEIIEGTGTGDGSTRTFYINSDQTPYISPTLYAEISAYSATINGEIATAYKPSVSWQKSSGQLKISGMHFLAAPPANSIVKFSICINGKNHIDVGTNNTFDSSTYGVNSVAIGKSTKSSGNNSLAAGAKSTASGSSSVAFNSATASAQDSFAANMGFASDYCSAAFGDSDAFGMYSFATGHGTVARTASQAVVGKYNKDDTNGDYAFIVGNGEFSTDSKRSNALTVDWNGNLVAQGMAGMIQMTACPAGGPGNTPLIPENNTTVYEPIPGWLICNGAAVSRTTYATLFAVIGTTYGAGDGSTTFNLPDLRGRTPIGAGQGTGLTNRTLGTQNIGAETVTLTESQLPQITGSFLIRHWASSTLTAIFNPTGKFSSTTQSVSASNIENNASNPQSAQKITYAFGGGQAHDNMQPSAVVNFIICTGKTF